MTPYEPGVVPGQPGGHADEDHGNFEAIFVEADNDVWHAFRDQSALAWRSAGTVT